MYILYRTFDANFSYYVLAEMAVLTASLVLGLLMQVTAVNQSRKS